MNNEEKNELDMKKRILAEIIFKERKNYNADEKDKVNEKGMVNKIRDIIEKEVKKNEV